MDNFIYNIFEQIKTLKKKHFILWFRGQSNSKYKLNSSLYRITNNSEILKTYENNLYNAFINYGDSFCSSFKDNKSWNVLFLMQHYGLYTRLLDWTDSFMVALYFATYQNKNTDACIWVVDPIQLNRNCIGLYQNEKIDYNINILTLETLPRNIKNQTNYFLNNNLNIGSFALIPRRNNDRLVSQNGFFTVQGTSTKSLETEYNNYIDKFLYKITIPKENIFNIKNFVLLNGINHFSLYGGVDGLCKYLKDELFNITLNNL